MKFSRPGLWTGLLGGVAASAGAARGRFWEALALGLVEGGRRET